ncbi:MAG TPA: hypothetical protein VGO35_04775 [Gammaproteobacteria bacterium]|nr:hypothetical protein [Gammaproteobacteria bacterium]
MAGTMPQLNEAESKFFESRGQDMAPALSEGLPESAEPSNEVETASEAAALTEKGGEALAASAPEKEGRQEKFVPLQALQQERAEKKQLREEIRQYREWQAQLAQRLQQFPHQPAQPMPDPQTKPLEYINHVLGNVQATTAELQQWRQQQEQTAQQRAAAQQVSDWAAGQEQEFAKSQPEYHEAYRYAADARDKELQALGYADPGARAAIVRQNTAEIINNAIQQERNPAELVWEYAQARGFTSKGKRASTTLNTGGNEEAQAKITAGLQAAGAKLNQGGATGEGEVAAKDLASITDPDEFEKAWKRVFGKKR